MRMVHRDLIKSAAMTVLISSHQPYTLNTTGPLCSGAFSQSQWQQSALFSGREPKVSVSANLNRKDNNNDQLEQATRPTRVHHLCLYVARLSDSAVVRCVLSPSTHSCWQP